MVFSVAIDSRAIEECKSHGKFGVGVVASLLNSLDQNCLLIECRKSIFSCDALIKSVDEIAEGFATNGPDFFARKRMTAALTKMRLSNRVKSLRVEQTSENADRTKQLIDALSKVVDQLIVVDSLDQKAANVLSLMDYSSSFFEWYRSKTCSEGISKKANECKIEQFLGDAFGTLLAWSDQVLLIDYSLGKNWKNSSDERNTNYTAAIPHWCSFLESFEREMLINIRTQAPREFPKGSSQRTNLATEIEEEFASRLKGSNVQVKVEFSDKVHSRFLYSCGFFIDIDRGIDICYKDGFVRRTSFGFKSDKKLESELR